MSKATPCARCHTVDGIAWKHHRQQPGADPRRADGTRYGIPGPLCQYCFGWARRHPVVEPCARCGTAGGRIPPKQHRPARVNGAHLGIAGLLCLRCYDDLRRTRQARHEARPPVLAAWPTKLVATPLAVYPDGPEAEEVQARLARLRAEKDRKYQRRGVGALTRRELDRVLPVRGGHAS